MAKTLKMPVAIKDVDGINPSLMMMILVDLRSSKSLMIMPPLVLLLRRMHWRKFSRLVLAV